MHQDSFGAMLADARRQCDYTVEYVANTLRIRTDIVLAIERSDVRALPPRAYARNMILRYARFVRLDPDSVLKLYDDLSYSTDVSDAFTSGTTTQRAGQFGFVSSRAMEGSPEANDPLAQQHPTRVANPINDAPAKAESAGPSDRGAMISSYASDREYGSRRSKLDSASPYASRSDAESVDTAPDSAYPRRTAAYRPARTNREDEIGLNRSVQSDSSSTRQARSQRTHQSTRSSMPDANTTNLCASHQRSSSTRNSLSPVAIIAIILGIALVIVVIVSFTTCGKSSTSTKTTTAPISGLTDTASSDEEDVQSIVAPVAPTSVEFVYNVESGVETYIEVYLDDSETASKAEVVSGPSKGSYTVTGKLKFVCTQPDGVKLTVDGESVELTSDPDTTWLYVYEIDFAEYLAKWQEAHAEEIAAAQKAKEELLAAQAAASASPSSGSGSDSKSSSSGKTTTTN